MNTDPDSVVRQYSPMVWKLAWWFWRRHRYVRWRATVEDIAQIGFLGLLRARELYDAERYPPGHPRHASFFSYAHRTVKNYILQWAKESSLVRTPTWAADALSAHEHGRESRGTPELLRLAECARRTQRLPEGFDVVGEEEELPDLEYLQYLLAGLSERERHCVERYYGLGQEAPKTYAEIALELGLCAESVRQIVLKSLRVMRRAAKAA